MMLTTERSLIIFALFFGLGAVLAIIYKLIKFAIHKLLDVLLEKTPAKFNKLFCAQSVSAVLTFLAFNFCFIFLAIELNYGIFRLFMLLASALGFYLIYKLLGVRIKKAAKTPPPECNKN